MNVRDFDPDKFINCEDEHGLFTDMLRFTDDVRVLSIRGPSGTGKSQLLHSFAYQCRTAHPRRIPVCLISFEQPGEAVLPLVQEMARQLTVFGLDFPSFKRLERSRIARDFRPFHSSIYLEGASFKEARDVRISGTTVNSEYVEKITISSEQIEFTPEQISFSQEVSIAAFFDDLQKVCTKTPVVLLLDAYEKCRDHIRSWIHEYFLEQFFFDVDQRPRQLVTVIAGQEIPSFRQFWPSNLCEAIVRVVPQLSAWERDHIEAYCKAHGLSNQSEIIEPINQISKLGGLTPELVKNIINTLLNQTRSR